MLSRIFQQSPKSSSSAKVLPQSAVRPSTINTNENRYIQKTACPCGGGCPRCRVGLPIQAKLKIGDPNDKYEQEADRVADQVMRMPEPNIRLKPS